MSRQRERRSRDGRAVGPRPERTSLDRGSLLALLGFESTVAADELFGAWRTFFERIAEHGTVVLVFEDMHFADSGLLDFIDHLLDGAAACRSTS